MGKYKLHHLGYLSLNTFLNLKHFSLSVRSYSKPDHLRFYLYVLHQATYLKPCGIELLKGFFGYVTLQEFLINQGVEAFLNG